MKNCKTSGWDELIPELLGLIFKKLSLKELLLIIPVVCKSWRETLLLGPYCWQEIDILQWSKNRDPHRIEKVLHLLIMRNIGSLHKLSVWNLSSDSFLSMVPHLDKTLHTLELPRSQISNSIVNQVAERFSALTFLDLSFCHNIGAPAIRAFGRSCPNLIGFRRGMLHLHDIGNGHSRDIEAVAVASTMRKLKCLEITSFCITTFSIILILENCIELEYLDVRGCWFVRLDEEIMKEFPRVKLAEDYLEDIDC